MRQSGLMAKLSRRVIERLSHHHHHHHGRHAMGRHRHGHGHDHDGLFHGGPGGFGGGDEPLMRGRKFSSDDLQLMLLALLEEKPSHGYELIKALETRSGGFYAPSPGMVYPALTYLEELGYATVAADGNKKCYHLAEAGRAHLAAHRERLELLLDKLHHVARKLDWIRRAWSGQTETEDPAGGWLPELVEARRALKRALMRRHDAPADEQRRIAAILARAAAEIDDKN